MESISQLILIVLVIVVFTKVRDGDAGAWFKAKFFNSAAPSPLSDAVAGGIGDVGTGIAGTAGDGLRGALEGLIVGVGGFVMPLAGAVTSGFGPRRSPGGIGSKNHKGIDIDGDTGDAVRAAKAGRVTFAGNGGGFGLKVDIDHGGGLVTRYAHLSRISVRVGQNVPAGAVIGLVGSTGTSTGPHLHFEILRNGVQVDPAGAIRGSTGMIASGILLVVVGVWLLLQTLVGALPSRILSWAGVK